MSFNGVTAFGAMTFIRMTLDFHGYSSTKLYCSAKHSAKCCSVKCRSDECHGTFLN
jgi:hypothetical protein